jgi:hypothetical protein
MMYNYSVERPDNQVPRRACTRRGKTTGCDDLHTIEDVICYTRQVAPEYAGSNHPGATCQALGHIVLVVALSY